MRVNYAADKSDLQCLIILLRKKWFLEASFACEHDGTIRCYVLLLCTIRDEVIYVL